MDRNAFLGTYFRQQTEFGMPELFISREIISAFRSPVKTAISSKVTLPLPGKTAQQQPPIQRSATPPVQVVSKPQTPIKSRLASLRPVESLVASAPKKTQPTSIPVQSEVPLLPAGNKREELKQLFIKGCSGCHLAETRTKFVFGSGNADAQIMVIGEAPGQEEDEQGLPFVGAAGKLLTTMLSAINLDRNSDVFITNVLKCRPPGNRNPESSEIITCLPLLKQQIAIIQPKAILLLGRIAAHAVLDISDSIAKMRSQFFDYQGISAMVIYHPAALLRNAEYKRPAWEDLQQFQQHLATLGIYGTLRKE